MRVRCYVC